MDWRRGQCALSELILSLSTDVGADIQFDTQNVTATRKDN